jgi:hypothetical protein
VADSFVRTEEGKCIHIEVELLEPQPFHLVSIIIDGNISVITLKEAITLGRMLNEIPLPKLR